MQELRQSTAITVKIGQFLDESNGKDAETGLTIVQADVRLSKNGGDIAQKTEATSCTHDELGIYGCPFDVTDTGTLGRLQLWVHESGALPVYHEFMVVTQNVWDSKYSTDKLQVDVQQWLGQACHAVSENGVPKVDLDQIGGVVQSLTDLKDLVDTGYDPATHKIQGVVLSDTITTYTGNTKQTANNNTILAHADYGLAKLVRSTTPANKLDVNATGEAGLDFNNIKDATGAHTLTNITIPVCTTNTDMVGTDNANTVVPDAAGVAATPAEVATALTNIHLDHLLAADYDPASKPGVATALLNELVENDGGVSRFTENSLEQAPSGTGASAATIADAVWDELQEDHVDVGSFGVIATEIAAIPTTAMRGTDGANTTTPPTVGEIADQVWDETLTGATHNVGDSPGKRLREMFDAGLYEEETAQAGSNDTITLADTASAIDDFYNLSTLTIIAGTGAGQIRTFKDYVGATKVATACDPWSINPDATSKYVIQGHACVGVFQMQTGVYDLINAECDSALTGYDGPTKTEMDAGHALLATEAKQDIIDTNVDQIETAVITNAAGTDIAADIIAVKAETVLIVEDTSELQTDWVNGGRLDLILDIIAADTTTDIPALIAALNNLSSANVNAEVVDVLKTDTKGEPAQGAPGATLSIEDKIAFIYKFLRNQVWTTETEINVYNNAADTVDHKSTISDDGVTFKREKFSSGP